MPEKKPTPYPYKEMGKAIANHRKRQGLSVEDVCGAIGISRATYYRFVRGQSVPSITGPQINELADLLDMNREDLQETYFPSVVPSFLPDLISLLRDQSENYFFNSLHGVSSPQETLEKIGLNDKTASDAKLRADGRYLVKLNQITAINAISRLVAYTEYYDEKTIQIITRPELAKIEHFHDILPRDKPHFRDLSTISRAMVNHVSRRYSAAVLYTEHSQEKIRDPLIRSIVLRDNIVAAGSLLDETLYAKAQKAAQEALDAGYLTKAAEAKVLEGLARAPLAENISQRWAWLKAAELAYRRALREEGPVPFIEAQIARTRVELCLATDTSAVQEISQVARQAHEIFERWGYLRYTDQLIRLLIDSGRNELKDLGEGLSQSDK